MSFIRWRIVYRPRRASRRPRRRRRAQIGVADFRARKELAHAIAVERLNFYVNEFARIAALDGFEPFSYRCVTIRNQRSRWGSCSASGNINFNFRILDLSPELRDYVIAHELCHVKELHHGKAFWDLLSRVIPNARALNRQVRSIEIGRAAK